MSTGRKASKTLSFSLPDADQNHLGLHIGDSTFKTCTLKKIAAVQSGEDGGLGLFTELAIGAEMEVVGPGFSDATVKVRCYGQVYFVFREDLGF